MAITGGGMGVAVLLMRLHECGEEVVEVPSVVSSPGKWVSYVRAGRTGVGMVEAETGPLGEQGVGGE